MTTKLNDTINAIDDVLTNWPAERKSTPGISSKAFLANSTRTEVLPPAAELMSALAVENPTIYMAGPTLAIEGDAFDQTVLWKQGQLADNGYAMALKALPFVEMTMHQHRVFIILENDEFPWLLIDAGFDERGANLLHGREGRVKNTDGFRWKEAEHKMFIWGFAAAKSTSTSRKRAPRELSDEAWIFWVVSFVEKSRPDEPRWKFRHIVVGGNVADVDVKKCPAGIPRTAERQAWCCNTWQKKFGDYIENTKQVKLDAVRLKLTSSTPAKGPSGFIEDDKLQGEIFDINKLVSVDTLKKHCKYNTEFFELSQAPSTYTLDRMRDQTRLTSCETFTSGWWYLFSKDTF